MKAIYLGIQYIVHTRYDCITNLFALSTTLKTRKETARSIPHVDRTDNGMYMDSGIVVSS